MDYGTKSVIKFISVVYLSQRMKQNLLILPGEVSLISAFFNLPSFGGIIAPNLIQIFVIAI